MNPTGGSGTGFVIEWSVTDLITGLPIANLNVDSLIPGIYDVTIYDNSLPGCEFTTVFTIEQPNTLSINASHGQIVTCFGGSDGSLSVDAINGTSPYSYMWSTISNNSISTDQSPSNLSSQMYYVEVTDTNGCTSQDSIFLNSTPQITPNLSFDNISCFGGNDGVAYLNPSGGTAPYNYFWSITGSTTSFSDSLNAYTNYSVQISDFNNCPNVYVNFTVPQPDSITMNVTIDSVDCYMGSNGSINLDNVSGGVGPYSFLWSNGQIDTLATNLTVRERIRVNSSRW